MTTVTRNTNRIERRAGTSPSRLRVVHGVDLGLEVTVPKVGVVIGAARTCDVVLTDPAVSSSHCSVKPTAHGFAVADLGSRNGTFFDGASIGKATVPPGALLRIGESVLELVPEEEVIEIPPSEATSFGGLAGKSLSLRRIYALLERAAASRAPVLLLGESGTGKEVCSRALHDQGPRRAGPFVAFDCGAASETLIESDLFGHVRGAFTGADRERSGAFASASGGTLLLDEIGDLPLRLQPKLLRVLETGEVTPLGATKPIKCDVRVVAATHHDLPREAARGAFRPDLYYRLSVVEVHLPPLRERTEDIPELVRLFLHRDGIEEQDLASKNLDKLLGYAWPGNVRELRNVVARAVALSPRGTPFAQMPVMLAGGAMPSGRGSVAELERPFHEAKADLLDRFEREYLEHLVARHGDNVSEAARVAGLERKYLYRLMTKRGVLRGARDDDEA